MKLFSRFLGMGLVALPFFVACTNNDGKNDGGTNEGGADSSVMCTNATTGGPVMGTNPDCSADGGMVITVDMAACHPEAGPPADGGMMGMGYGPTNVGTQADDDDCKYKVKWSSTPICQGANVTFTMNLDYKADGKPATGAFPYAEVFLPPSHPAPDTKPMMTETMPGVYTLGPYKFDQPGKWTVRFHFFPQCEDTLDETPHGHAAFFVNVP